MRLLFFFLFFSTQVHAFGVFVEPSLGYNTGSFEDQSQDVKTNGFGIQGKGGVILYKMLMGGLDFQFSTLFLDNAVEDKWENRQYGLFGGVDGSSTGLPFKFWLTLFPYEELEHDTRGELFGSGYKLGLGFYPEFLEFLGFVFELKNSSFDKIQDASGERDLIISTKVSTLYFGVSFFFKDEL
ncbi:MAG: hypothetical protein EP326_13000 [Deltaproteobacteria bacterium]|nr:MAG: hypothetical protein EP326_13000 [Deltaproteobacteria bacterium]